MLWELRERFPLHFIVFKHTGSHLSHEASVLPSGNSRAGNLSDPNMDPEYLAHLVMVGVRTSTMSSSAAEVARG